MSKKIVFQAQTTRKDMLENMLKSKHCGRMLFEKIMTFDGPDESKKGFLFECLITLLMLARCFPLLESVGGTSIYVGRVSAPEKLRDTKKFLDEKICQGNNSADLIIKQGDDFIAFSVKYKKKHTDVFERLPSEVGEGKIGVFVKDKKEYTSHKYRDKDNSRKRDMEKVIENKLLFDTDDVFVALDQFYKSFHGKTSREFISQIDESLGKEPKKILRLKLHQKMHLMKLTKSLAEGGRKWCLSNKPRSGKSIVMLLFGKELIEQGHRVLLATSVPDTLDSFYDDLDKYEDFSDIKYAKQ